MSSLPYIPGKFLHLDTLYTLGIREEIETLINGIGWGPFFHLRMPAFTKLFHEFFCTFFFEKTTMLTVQTLLAFNY